MNTTTLTLKIINIKNLYDLIKASGADDMDEITVTAHGAEHIPTEDGEMFETGYLHLEWNKVSFMIPESNEENQ
jgi:hypothetical protein